MIKLPEVLVKNNYEAYLQGSEVEASAILPANTTLHQGEHVLVFKDTVAATSNVPVPKEKQSRYIGVEGEVTQLGLRHHQNGSPVQVVKVKKV